MPVMRSAPLAPWREGTSQPLPGYSAAQGKKASELVCNAAWLQAVHEELDGGVVDWQPAEGTLGMVLETDPFNVCNGKGREVDRAQGKHLTLAGTPASQR